MPNNNNSFALFRTNPKFTSNVKLTVDQDEKIYLSAFNANKSLAKTEFQKYDIKSSNSYAYDVSVFYKNLPLNKRYEVLRKKSDLTPYSKYNTQYEDQYHYGASFNTTKLYNEQYKLLAPIWLNKKVPTRFIIYRIDDVDYRQQYLNNIQDQNNRILELLQKSTIIKNYDLTKNSNLGKYLNNHVNSDGFSNTPLSINFDTTNNSIYRGIDILKGGFITKNIDINKDYLTLDQPEIFANEYLTNNFESNGIISSNLINLEFLFDDHSAEKYKIYRYFGLYVDDYDECEFQIDAVDSNNLVYVNRNSYKSYYNLENTNLTDQDMILNVNDLKLPTLNYIKDKKGFFYHVKNNTSVGNFKIPLNNSNKEFLNHYAKTNDIIKIKDDRDNFRSFIKFKITNKPNDKDRIFFADKTELKINKYNLNKFLILADKNLPASTATNGKFSNQGSLHQITIALSKAIKLTNQIVHKIHVQNNNIIIEDESFTFNKNRIAFAISNRNIINFIEVISGNKNNLDLEDTNTDIINVLESNTQFINWNIWTLVGGGIKNAVFLVDKSELGTLKAGQYLKIPNIQKFIKIKEIVKDPFNDAFRIICSKKINVKGNLIQIYKKFKFKHGKFNVYNIKDFNFDFFDTLNSNIGDLNYEKNGNNNYFHNLSNILQKETIEEKSQKILANEYNRLNENKLKETALKSKVVPTIMKFCLNNGINARNLPYMLTVSEAFGVNNISPNINISGGRDVNLLNMEHLHISKIPDYFFQNNTLTGLESYPAFRKDDDITIDMLKDVNIDYFSIYFNREGVDDYNEPINYLDNYLGIGISNIDNSDPDSLDLENNNLINWIDDKNKKLYTNFNSYGNSQSTVFRGLRYIFKKRKISKRFLNEYIDSNEVDNYKFATVLKYKQGSGTNTVNYQVIKNDVHKFICVVITIDMIQNNIKYLDRYSLYNLENIKDDNNNIVNTPIPFYIKLGKDINGNSFDFVENQKNKVYASNFAIENKSAKFTDYIKPNNNGEYSWIIFKNIDDVTYGLKVINVVNDSEITVFGKPIMLNPNNTFNTKKKLDNISEVPISNQFEYYQGGANGFTNVLNKIIAYNYSNKFNNQNDVRYITVNKLETKEQEFYLQIQDGTELIKASLLESKIDTDKPKSYQLSSNKVGREITKRQDGGYFIKLKRLNGNYIPLFKDIITFSSIYANTKKYNILFDTIKDKSKDIQRSFLIYNKFKNLGIAFESYKTNSNTLKDWGIIKNHFYHKVNDENSKNILKLSETTNKLPLYPEIGEIAIDKRDVNVLKSKYSLDYFTKNLSGGKSKYVNGLLSLDENKSYLTSTIMKVSNAYNLTSYSAKKENSINTLDSIKDNSLNTADIHWIESEDQIISDFYVSNIILNKLIDDNIKSKFVNYLNSIADKQDVEIYLREYVYANIVPRFIIDNVEIYGIKGKQLNTDFVPIENLNNLNRETYMQQTDFEIQQYQNKDLIFRLIYNKSYNYNYKLKVLIKIQA